ncbi:hypothetical protein HON58_01665, partial [Candidatus Peregrinibacteria bacterium]|nr:hypothetical protein [Candidatus Peregrinibacteria bacterium]
MTETQSCGILFVLFLKHMGNNPYKKFFDIETLVKRIKRYLPDFDAKKFKKAYQFAEDAHEGQMRKDKKTPYLAHPVSVVDILVK